MEESFLDLVDPDDAPGVLHCILSTLHRGGIRQASPPCLITSKYYVALLVKHVHIIYIHT